MTDELDAARQRQRDLVNADLRMRYARHRLRRWDANDTLRQLTGKRPASDLHPDDLAAHYPTDDDDAA